jgi:hypothetical protein
MTEYIIKAIVIVFLISFIMGFPMTEYIFNVIGRFWNKLFGNKKLRPYEQLIFDAWRDTLSESNKKVLDEQFRLVELIQRQAGDAKVCFYYSKNYNGLLFDLKDVVHIATVLISSNDEKTYMRAKLYLVNGRFFSIDFPKRPDIYMKKRGVNIKKDELHIVSVVSYLE